MTLTLESAFAGQARSRLPCPVKNQADGIFASIFQLPMNNLVSGQLRRTYAASVAINSPDLMP